MTLKERIAEAREAGVTAITIDGVTYNIGLVAETKVATAVPELKPEQIVAPLSILDDLTEEEILFWSTPHYDEIQEQKAAQAAKAKEELNG
jgi:hypothetical protein